MKTVAPTRFYSKSRLKSIATSLWGLAQYKHANDNGKHSKDELDDDYRPSDNENVHAYDSDIDLSLLKQSKSESSPSALPQPAQRLPIQPQPTQPQPIQPQEQDNFELGDNIDDEIFNEVEVGIRGMSWLSLSSTWAWGLSFVSYQCLDATYLMLYEQIVSLTLLHNPMAHTMLFGEWCLSLSLSSTAASFCCFGLVSLANWM
ncbi:hypothetical protein RHSIM_Rhsim11G0004900 [Rhododendron simsii]|uniref:Uncharacterized protein n=1 Tax=Rhododendron simsii TaxID=118357 RepID=A0A834GBE5_RHOSS|nr:hypothetical protein RHSIM_Rhsim11G0004900 [Rhododendron simsii]